MIRHFYQSILCTVLSIVLPAGAVLLLWNYLLPEYTAYRIFGISVLAILLSFFLAKRTAVRLARPFFKLDPEHPEQFTDYAELSPILLRLTEQNRLLAAQADDFRRQRAEFRTISENMREGLILIDQSKTVLFHNQRVCELLFPDVIFIKGKNVLTLSSSAAFEEAVTQALGGTHDERVFSVGNRVFQLLANPVQHDLLISGAVLVVLDVTERAERESLRREFTANVSHELKTPLTSISGVAEIMKSGLVRPEDIPHFAENIYNETQRMIRLVVDIIKLSRLDEANDSKASFEPVDLSQIADAVLDALAPKAQKNKVTLSKDTDICTVQGIPTMIDELLYNLVDNAIEYNKTGGSVLVAVKQEGAFVVLSVSDTGIGIPLDQQERVFERFYRVDKSHSKQVGGTGLGLSIVKHTVSYLSASLSLKSEPGRGTIITVRFPITL